MTNNRARFHLSILGIVVVAFLGVIGAGVSRSQNPKEAQDPNEHAELVDALRRGGLREAARIKGHYVTTKRTSWDAIFSDLESLTSHSKSVIVGMPLQSSSRLSPGGDTILTDYKMNVLDALKGKIRSGSSVTVTTVGGFVRFEDGTSAEVRTPDIHIQNGKTYVLFLYAKSKTEPDSLYITGGPQGIFEISDDGVSILPMGRQIDHVAKKYKEKRADAFVHEIREAAEKWPGDPKCCQ